MLLEEMVHAFWRDSTALCTAIPPERFFTDTAIIPCVPCVVYVHEKTEILLHSNRAEPWKKIGLRFEIHHTTFEEGVVIARLVETNFDRLRLNEPGGNWSYLFRLIQSEDKIPEEKAWKFIRRFRLIG